MKLRVPKLSARSQRVTARSRDLFPRKWRKWRPLAVILLCLLVIAIVAVWVLKSKLFTVQKITVSQAVLVKPAVVPMQEIEQEVNKSKGSWIWIGEDSLSTKLEKRFPAISSAEIHIQWPDAIKVSILPRVPLSQLITPQGVYLVDRGGFVFSRLPKEVEGLPALRASAKPTVGSQISTKGVQLGLQIVNGLRGVQPGLRQVNLHDGQLDIHLASPPLVLISEDKVSTEVLPQLLTLLQRFAAEQRFPNEVDMRYDRPVLRY